MSSNPFDAEKPLTDSERIESLENEVNNLRETIRRLVELSQNFAMPVLGIEIVRELSDWADPDETDVT